METSKILKNIGIVNSYVEDNRCIKCGRLLLKLLDEVWERCETSEIIDYENFIEWGVDFRPCARDAHIHLCDECKSLQIKCTKCNKFCELSILPNYEDWDTKILYFGTRDKMRSATDEEEKHMTDDEKDAFYLVPFGEFAYPTPNTPQGHWITSSNGGMPHVWHCLTCDTLFSMTDK